MLDVTILINGCDKYQDAWEPFIKLLYIQWKDCPYPIVLNTESIDYEGAYSENVTTIHPEESNMSWSERLRGCLEKIDTEFVLFMIEDYFIQHPVSTEVFEHALSLMQTDKRIGMAALSYGKTNVKTDGFEDAYFYSRIINKQNMIWCRINLYRKDYLQKLIRNHETVWEFEEFAPYRAKKQPYYIIQQKSSVPECFTFYMKVEQGYGITRGKWLPKNVELFEKYGIQINYERLGFLETNTNKQQNPVQSKGAVREALYKIKHWIKIKKRKIKKFIRNTKSKF